MLTQKEIKELLHYNPETGIFTWKVGGGNRVKAGDTAGYVNSHGYVRVERQGKTYAAHRLAWLYMVGEWPKNNIDHVNGIKDDNRWDNLREASNQQNNFNRASRCNSSSKHKGVSWHKRSKKWTAKSMLSGVSYYLGYFDCEHEAALVFNQFAMKHHGEYARFNQVYNHFDVEVGRDD